MIKFFSKQSVSELSEGIGLDIDLNFSIASIQTNLLKLKGETSSQVVLKELDLIDETLLIWFDYLKQNEKDKINLEKKVEALQVLQTYFL